jgi:hypothetical protein
LEALILNAQRCKGIIFADEKFTAVQPGILSIGFSVPKVHLPEVHRSGCPSYSYRFLWLVTWYRLAWRAILFNHHFKFSWCDPGLVYDANGVKHLADLDYSALVGIS